nr:hypothetical protein [Candidatus Levybacteria bacterium]
MDFNLLKGIILFVVFLISAIYLPGKLFLQKLNLKITILEATFSSFVLGILLFTLINYIFSWLKLESLVLIPFLIIDFMAIKAGKFSIKVDKKLVKPLFFVFLLSLIFSSTMLVYGKFGNNLNYRGDDLWHLALINELKTNFPPDNPGFSELPLKGYHFFYNFLVAKASNLFFIPSEYLHFTFIPVSLAILWGFGVFTLVFGWSKKISTALWSVFLTMFGGSFAFMLSLQGHLGYNLNSGFGMNQPFGSLYNPPFSISIVILIFSLFALYKYESTKNKNWLVPLTLSIGLVTMFKVYAGMILFGGFLLYAVYELYQKRLFIIWPIIGILALFWGTFWIFSGGTGFLTYYPFWPPHRLLQSYAWYGYDEKMYTYTRLGVIKGLIQTEIDGLNMFILGNLGSRTIGLIILIVIFIKKRVYPSKFAITLFLMALISILVPMFFIQPGKVFEIIQMSHYFLFFASIFAAFGFSYFFSLHINKFVKTFLFIVVISVTIPSTIYDLPNYYSALKSARSLSSPYFQTMNYLSSLKDYNSTVLEVPGSETEPNDKSMIKWYRESSDPGIIAFSNKRSYLNNQYIEFPGMNIAKRFGILKKIILLETLSNKDVLKKSEIVKEIRAELIKNNISFIFSPYKLSNIIIIKEVRQIYENKPYYLYEVNLSKN